MTEKFEGRLLTLNGESVELEVRIKDVEPYKDLLLVLLDDEMYQRGDDRAERNAIALSKSGRLVWRIQRTPSAPIRGGRRVWNAYVGIGPGESGRPIEAYDWTGRCWKVDPETGEVSDPIFTR